MNNNLFLFVMGLFIALNFSSCSNDDDTVQPKPTVTKKVENLYAPQEGGRGEPITGDFVKFSFEKGTTVTDNNWDVAFRGSSIIVNGGVKKEESEPARTGEAGVYVADGTMASLKSANINSFQQDSATTLAIPSFNTWADYTGAPRHAVVPKAGKILVFKTHDGKYAKMEILSYYKDSPAVPDYREGHQSRYYTFNYVYQPNKGTTSF